MNTDMNASKRSASVNAFVYVLTPGDFVRKHACRKKRVDTSNFLVDIGTRTRQLCRLVTIGYVTRYLTKETQKAKGEIDNCLFAEACNFHFYPSYTQ